MGVNDFVTEEPGQKTLFRVNDAVRESQKARLSSLRARRDSKRVQNALQSLQDAARGTNNLFPALITCIESYATLGEISDVLRAVWGEYS